MCTILFFSALADAVVLGIWSQSEQCILYYGKKLVTGYILKIDKGKRNNTQLFHTFFVRLFLRFKILSFVDVFPIMLY